jgi:CheY-like chemotaxis protein
MKILVMDNDPDNFSAYQMMLLDLADTMICASSEREAMNRWAHWNQGTTPERRQTKPGRMRACLSSL